MVFRFLRQNHRVSHGHTTLEESAMATQPTSLSMPHLQLAERTFLFGAMVTLVVAAAYILGATGLPGDALVLTVDWLSAQGYLHLDTPQAELALAAIRL